MGNKRKIRPFGLHWIEKKNCMEWKEVFINHISDKELLSRIDKTISKIEHKKTQLQNEHRTWVDISPKMYRCQ